MSVTLGEAIDYNLFTITGRPDVDSAHFGKPIAVILLDEGICCNLKTVMDYVPRRTGWRDLRQLARRVVVLMKAGRWIYWDCGGAH